MTEGGGVIVPFRCLLNYLSLVFVGSVHSGVTTVSLFVCMYLCISVKACVGFVWTTFNMLSFRVI